MRYLYFLLLIMSTGAVAQLPRNELDQYEYSQEISLNLPDSVLIQRVRTFFRQPFIVHWDSVAFAEAVHTGKGHIMIRINHRLKGFTIPVALKLEIAVTKQGYRYAVRHLEADKKNSKYLFPLEQKPPAVNALIYEQLLQKTHRYMGAVISLVKRYMSGEM